MQRAHAERMSQPPPTPVHPLFIRESSLTSKQHSQLFPVGSTVICRQKQTTHTNFHTTALSHIHTCTQVYIHTYIPYVCTQQTYTKNGLGLYSKIPSVILPSIGQDLSLPLLITDLTFQQDDTFGVKHAWLIK